MCAKNGIYMVKIWIKEMCKTTLDVCQKGDIHGKDWGKTNV